MNKAIIQFAWKEKNTKMKKHQNFIRIGWQEALDAMHSALEIRYKTRGKLMLMKDHGSDGVEEFYDEPSFVDLYLEVENKPASELLKDTEKI